MGGTMSEGANEREFLFSVILPVYNTAEYVTEAIESILNQSIGFEENIQLVIVNDGSTDDSGEICERYAERYPDNVLYIYQENAGVSAARNAGLAQAYGRYVNFMDSDDKWSRGAFRTAAAFFARHKGVGVVTTKQLYFDAKRGGNPLNYRFTTQRVIDIIKEPDCALLATNSSWIERRLLDGKAFDTRLSYAEDAKLVNELVLAGGRYGVLKKPTYWYRKRSLGGSALDESKRSLSYHLDTPEMFHKYIFELSRELYGCVIPYAQYVVMYDLQWRLRSSLVHPLSAQQYEQYKAVCVELLQNIEDAIIVQQRDCNRDQKLAILALKYGTSTEAMRECLRIVNNITYLEYPAGRMHYLWNVYWETRMQLEFMERRGKKLIVKGVLFTLLPRGRVEVYFQTAKKKYKARVFERPDKTHNTFFEKDTHKSLGFSVRIPLVSFSIQVRLDGKLCNAGFTNAGKFFPLRDGQYAYAVLGDRSVHFNASEKKFVVRKRNTWWFIKREILLERSMLRSGKHEVRAAVPLRRQAFWARVLHEPKQQVWLISDRPRLAGDNGQALFEYLMKHPVPGVKPYFVLAEDSPDFAAMQDIGPVVPYFSKQHERLLAQANKVISSSGDETDMRLSKVSIAACEGLPKPEYVFLQHGVIHDNLSGWLKRQNKNIALFCTTAPRERESIIGDRRYGYSGKQVKLTGLARHDKLLAKAAAISPERKVLIAPTWRQWAALPLDAAIGEHPYNPDFTSTEYFMFWDRLLNDADIAAAVRAACFTVDFVLHPVHVNNMSDYSSSFARIVTKCNYSEEFVSSAILVTDYSSVAFDFAILKKPLLYAQFDEERFFGGEHTRQHDYFDYSIDGFGPVCKTYEQTKAELLRLLENPVMAPEYQERVDGFFGPLDGHACERIVQAILDLDK